MNKFLARLVSEEEGATMIEYALMVALIGAALVAVVTTLSSSIGGQFTSVGNTVAGAS